jgi:hypothetical protein
VQLKVHTPFTAILNDASATKGTLFSPAIQLKNSLVLYADDHISQNVKKHSAFRRRILHQTDYIPQLFSLLINYPKGFEQEG